MTRLAQEQVSFSDPLSKTYDEEYTLVLKGFDARVVPSAEEPGSYDVELYESGVKVFEDTLPTPLGSEGLTPSATVNLIVQIAIDFFEAGRGTLGLGAGCMVEKKSNSKVGCVNFSLPPCLEEDFRSLLCTEQENLAKNLLQQFVFNEIEVMNVQAKLAELSSKHTKVFQDLLLLDLERALTCKDMNVEMIVLASMVTDDVDAYLSKFKGTKFEVKALQLCAFAMDVFKEMSELEARLGCLLDKSIDLSCQMDELKTEALADSIKNDLQELNLDLLPEATKSLMDLSEGVSSSENPLSLLNLS